MSDVIVKEGIVYLVYSTDFHHTGDSKILLGVGGSKGQAVYLAYSHSQAAGYPLTDQSYQQLLSMNQTQGHEGDGEYLIDPEPLNEALWIL